jgi:uncharacterized coiled-coil protein SlyX
MAQSFSAFCFAFLAYFLMITRSAVAVEPAEIININYKYKIAFSDLTENDIKPGELVAVIVPDGTKVYLKALETYPVMVKLTVPDDAAHALTDEQFSAISVGSQVVAGDKLPAAAPGVQAKIKKPSPKAAGPKIEVLPAQPKTAVQIVRLKEPVSGEEAIGPSVSLAEVRAFDTGSRMAVLESRLDQMMANNVKLADSITLLIADKNASEAKARVKEAVAAEALQKVDALSAENTVLKSRVLTLGANIAALEQDKAAQKKEIENLNVKLVELKKKLSKTVEIINNNMKAYEKQ